MNLAARRTSLSLRIAFVLAGFAVVGSETAFSQDGETRRQRPGSARLQQYPAWLLDARQAGLASAIQNEGSPRSAGDRTPTWLPENYKQSWAQVTRRPHFVQRTANVPAPIRPDRALQPKIENSNTKIVVPTEPRPTATTTDSAPQLPNWLLGLTHIPIWMWGLFAIGLLSWMVRSKSSKAALPKSDPIKQEPPRPDLKFDIEVSINGSPINVSIDTSPPVSREVLVAEGNRAWVSQNQFVEIGGLKIYGPLYCGSKLTPLFENGLQDNCLIDPSMKIGSRPDDVGQSMDYWPSYASMSPNARRAFLNWMASDRSDPKTYIGYVFLYFYGIERRLILENSSAERNSLQAEVERLLRIYGSNRSFKRYANELLSATALFDQNKIDKTPRLFEPAGGELPSSVKIAIGRKLKERSVIEAEWLLSWTMSHPRTKVRTPARRVFGEIARLFIAKYRQRFPGGLKLEVNAAPNCEFVYRAASSTFEKDLSEQYPSIPDPFFHQQGLEIGRAILESCTTELESYSRTIGKNPELANRLEALSQLPGDLRPSAIERAEFIDDIRATADRMGRASLTQLYGQVCTSAQKVTPSRYRDLCDVLARCSIGVAPDPRFSIATTVPEDVVLFPLANPIEQIEPTIEYRPTLLALALGAMVAQADGEIGESERRLLIEQASLCGKQLSSEEGRRLIADLRWLNANPLELKSVRSRLKNAPAEDRESIAKLLVDVANADGRADRSTVVLLEKLYKQLDLKLDRLYSEINDGIKIPPPANDDSNIHTLPNRPTIKPNDSLRAREEEEARLAAIRAESDAAARILKDILDEDGDVPSVKNDSGNADSTDMGIDTRYLDFVRLLIQKAEWKKSEFERLAREQGFMAGAVIEELNDWSHNTFDDTLVEDGDPIIINCDLVSAYFSEAAE